MGKPGKHIDFEPREHHTPELTNLDEFVRPREPRDISPHPESDVVIHHSGDVTTKPMRDVSMQTQSAKAIRRPRVKESKYRKQPEGNEFSRVGVYIPPDLLKELRLYCVNEELTLSDAVTRFLERGLRSKR